MIVAAELEPKPQAQAYERFLAAHAVDPGRAVMFEDLARNLAVPHALGMTTVLVLPARTRAVFRQQWDLEGRDAAHVDHFTDDLTGFLRRIAAELAPPVSRRLDITCRRPDKAPLKPRVGTPRMPHSDLARTIDAAFEARDGIGPNTRGAVREAVEAALDLLDRGEARVAERRADGSWHVHQWLKKAVLLSFRLNDMTLIGGGPGSSGWWDKVPSKFLGWSEQHFQEAGFRAVPSCVVRRSAFIARGVVLMPCFVNVGARVDAGTMIDTWATVGSCAQVGKNCHISGGAGIGGVLEPLQAEPVIIEDHCFIGARAEVAEGVIVREGGVLAMGVFLGASTKIVDRDTGRIFQGEVPPYSVVVPGTIEGKPIKGGNMPAPGLYCAVIVKRVDEQTRAKTSINELLRD